MLLSITFALFEAMVIALAGAGGPAGFPFIPTKMSPLMTAPAADEVITIPLPQLASTTLGPSGFVTPTALVPSTRVPGARIGGIIAPGVPGPRIQNVEPRSVQLKGPTVRPAVVALDGVKFAVLIPEKPIP